MILFKLLPLLAKPVRVQVSDFTIKFHNKIHENSHLPKKKSKYHPLTKIQKKENRQLAKQRVAIEHRNAYLKVFKLA
jgi:hypothetical protein